jgi:uncharacterized protein YqeY
MENLKEKIQQQMKEAFKAGDTTTRSTLSLLLAAIKNKEIERKGQGKEEELSNDDIIEIIGTEVKKRKDAAEQYEKGGRPELAQKEKDEMAVLEKYLPEQLSEEEIAGEIEKIIEETGAEGMRDMGRVMGQVMQKLKGKADGSLVNRIVKEKLSS